MRTKKVFLGLMILAVSGLLFTQSCSKEAVRTISATDILLAEDETYADALFEEVDNMVSSELTSLDAVAYSTSTLKSANFDVCRNITVDHPDSTRFPKIVTIDYGDGCTNVFNNDTITRAGKIIVTVSGRWNVEGSQHSVTFEDFYINGVKIEGTRITTNLGINERRHLELGIELEDGKVIFNDTGFISRESSHVREIIKRPNPQFDTIIVTGSANGVNVLGEEYTRTITDPLVLVHCAAFKLRWVISDGTVEITNSVRGNTTIEYNSDGCDGKVIINKNGYRHNYRFKYNHRNHKGGN